MSSLNPVLQNGLLTDLIVSTGTVSFEGAGGNFQSVPVLDVLARKVQIDAPINGGGALNIIAGNNDFKP